MPFEIPENWKWCKVEDFSYGLQYGTSEKSQPNGSVCVLRMGNITRCGTIDYSDLVYSSNEDDIAKFSLQYNDLLFNRTNSSEWVGKTAIYKAEKPAIYAGYLIRIRTFVVCPDFINYVMNSPYHKDWCNQVKTDAVNQSNINAQKLSKLQIPIPPFDEQKRIVEEVQKWFALIDDVEQNKIDLLEKIKQVKTKVLDLAIHGKLVPQDATDEPAIELLKCIMPNYKPCDTSHYENIPKSWCIVRLGDIGKWQAGGTPKRSIKDYYGGDIPWLKTGDLNDGFITDIPEYITQAGLENSAAKLNPKGSVLVAMYGATIGRIGILTFPATTNQACCACIEYPSLEMMYLYYFLLSHRDTFISQGGGGAQPNISKEIIKNTQMPLPPKNEQKRIVDKIAEIFSYIDEISGEL